MRGILKKLAMTACLILPVWASAAEVTEDVRNAISQRGEVRVMVLLTDHDRLQHDRDVLASRVDGVLAAQRGVHVRLERRFETIPALALTIDAEGLRALEASSDIAAVSLDPGGEGQLVQSLPLAEIDQVQDLGFRGAGRKLAVIDSGVRLDHQSFAGRIVGQACFCTTCCPNGQATQIGAGSAADNNGHGTNVTGIAAGGTGAGAVPAGAASQTQIVAIKSLAADGSFSGMSDIVAALDWLRVNHPDTAAVNLSLGSFQLFPGHCDTSEAWTQTLAIAVNGLVNQSTSVVACTANQGSSSQIAAPACITNAVAVGAVWDSNVGSATVLGCTDATTAADKMTCFTNISPVMDVVAPGAWVTAAGMGSPTGTSTYAGTSMATPMVAGCLTQLREAFPRLSRAQLEAAVMASPTRVTRSPLTQTWPRLDCLDAFDRLDRLFANGFQ